MPPGPGGSIHMRNLAIVALCLVLGGCGLAARAERQKQMAAAVAAAQQGYADCKTQFPEESKQAFDRNKCSYEVAKTNPAVRDVP